MKRKVLGSLGCVLFLIGFINAAGGNVLIGAYISAVGILVIAWSKE